MSNRMMLPAVALACALATPAALAAPVNVAHLHGSATANQTYSVNVAANAIDDDDATDWVAPDHGTLSDPNWLVVDLSTPFSVDAIDLYWQKPDGLYSGYTVVYSLFHSLNGADWTLIGSGTFVDEDPGQISAQYLFGSGESMRYAKYEVNGGSHWSGIAEIRVWSEAQDPPASVPQPATRALLMAGLLGLASWSAGWRVGRKPDR